MSEPLSERDNEGAGSGLIPVVIVALLTSVAAVARPGPRFCAVAALCALVALLLLVRMWSHLGTGGNDLQIAPGMVAAMLACAVLFVSWAVIAYRGWYVLEL